MPLFEDVTKLLEGLHLRIVGLAFFGTTNIATCLGFFAILGSTCLFFGTGSWIIRAALLLGCSRSSLILILVLVGTLTPGDGFTGSNFITSIVIFVTLGKELVLLRFFRVFASSFILLFLTIIGFSFIRILIVFAHLFIFTRCILIRHHVRILLTSLIILLITVFFLREGTHVIHVIHSIILAFIISTFFVVTIQLHLFRQIQRFLFFGLRIGHFHVFATNSFAFVVGVFFVFILLFLFFFTFFISLLAFFSLLLLFLGSRLFIGLGLTLAFFIFSLLLILIIGTIPKLLINSTSIKIINIANFFIKVVFISIFILVFLVTFLLFFVLTSICIELFLIHVDSIRRIIHFFVGIFSLWLLREL